MIALARSLYSLVGTAITPALELWLEHRARHGKEDPFRLKEKFGHASLSRPEGILVWLHAASVGETQSVLTLVRALLAQNPALHVLITTGTVTSAALVAQQNFARVAHQFLPVDTKAAVKRFLQHWRPDLVLWVESEFWPQLLWQIAARRTPMLLINARISEHTFRHWKRWPRIIGSLLTGFTSIYAGSHEDAARLRTLGGQNVRDIGNLKYDADPLPINTKLSEELHRQTSGRPVFVAASTHASEESYVAETHALAAQQFPSLLTIIIPRHPARGASIATDLRAGGFTLAQRSKSEAITPQTHIYLADTMGELGSFYVRADTVFMGGSLIPHGGQNPLEAARFGKAILTGPHTHNFAAIITQFVAAQAIRVVRSTEELAVALITLLKDNAARQNLGNNAAQLVKECSGASTVIVQHCIELLARGRA